MPQALAFRILDAAWDMGVRGFDTAEAYGESAARLRAWIDATGRGDTVQVVTKCPVGAAMRDGDSIRARADAALARFGGLERLLLLTHGAVKPSEWDAVLSVADRRGASAGQSVYTPSEVTAACAMPGTARVQAPGSVLDTRAFTGRAHSPVPLDIRSVFLQGVLLEDPAAADHRAPGASRVTIPLSSAAAALGADLATVLLASVLHTSRGGDRVVLGVDDPSQLEILPAAVAMREETVREFLQATGHLAGDPATQLIRDPRTWPADGAA